MAKYFYQRREDHTYLHARVGGRVVAQAHIREDENWQMLKDVVIDGVQRVRGVQRSLFPAGQVNVKLGAQDDSR